MSLVPATVRESGRRRRRGVKILSKGGADGDEDGGKAEAGPPGAPGAPSGDGDLAQRSSRQRSGSRKKERGHKRSHKSKSSKKDKKERSSRHGRKKSDRKRDRSASGPSPSRSDSSPMPPAKKAASGHGGPVPGEQGPASASGQPAEVGGRMGWMSQPAGPMVPPAPKEETQSDRDKAARDARVEKEIKAGLRDKDGNPIGLWRPPPRTEAEKAEEERIKREGSDAFHEYWAGRDGGGTGTASRMRDKRRAEGVSVSGRDADVAADAEPTQAYLVGDGGAAWRRKALQRAQQRAREEGHSVDGVLSEQWGGRQGLEVDSRGVGFAALPPSQARRGRPRGGGGGGDRGRERRPRDRSPRDEHDFRHNPDRGRRQHQPKAAPLSRDEERAEARMERGRRDRERQARQEASDRASFLYGGGKQRKPAPAPAPAPAPVPPGGAAPAPAPDATPADVNKLAAALMRAEMAGNEAKAAQLRQQLAAARGEAAPAPTPAGPAEAAPAAPAPAERRETVPVVAEDMEGRALAGAAARRKAAMERDDLRLGKRRGRRQEDYRMNRVAADGERAGYFAEDARAFGSSGAASGGGGDQRGDLALKDELKEMAAQERREDAGEFDRRFARNVARDARFKGLTGSKSGRDEEEDVDMKLLEDRDARLTGQRRQEVETERAQRSTRRLNTITQSCGGCMRDNPSFKRHLVVALGEHTYLKIMERPLVPGHCIIAPVEHVASLAKCGDDVWAEIAKFRRSLEAMFKEEDEGTVYLETASDLGFRSHAYLEVIPVPREAEEDAPIYFKKALSEVDEEWAQNKKILDTTGKGLRKTIPDRFPYFHAEWGSLSGPPGGFAHVVEDVSQFPKTFGIDVVAGMLGMDPKGFGRRAQPKGPQVERDMVKAFLKRWAPHDWTAELDGGAYE